VIAPSAYPLGGVATWLDGLVPGLRARGIETEVALLAGEHHDVDRYCAAHPALGPARRITNPGGSRVGRRRALEAAIRQVGPDVVLSVNVADVELAIDRLRAQGATRARLTVSQHGILPAFLDHLRAHRDAVDLAICTNRLTVALALKLAGLPVDRVAYAPYGVAMEEAGSDRSRDNGPLRILWAGRLESSQKRARDLPGIVEALDRRRLDYRLRVAGAGPDEAALRERLERPGGRVSFLGSLSPGRMRREAYADSDVLLVTSSWETGPIIAWEAFAAGVAVVSSRFLGSGVERALVDGENVLFFAPGDVEGAAMALARSADGPLRRRLLAAGRERVGERYTLERSLDAWEEAIRASLPRPPRATAGLRERVRPAGRLDRVLGARGAETVRAALGRRNPQGNPGAEWPHAYGRSDLPGFLELATRLDAAGSSGERRIEAGEGPAA